MPTALVCGAGGFIGGHLVRRLKQEDSGFEVSISEGPGVCAYSRGRFVQADLRNAETCECVVD